MYMYRQVFMTWSVSPDSSIAMHFVNPIAVTDNTTFTCN